jgi:hypothetical protein
VIKFVSDFRTDWWFSAGTLVSSTNKTDCHDIAEILLKVVLNTIKQTIKVLCVHVIFLWDCCISIIEFVCFVFSD